MSAFIIPVFILFIFVYGLFKGVNTYQSFVKGAKAALKLTFDILPFIATILIAIHLFAASGLLDALAWLTRPVFDLLGIPHELTPFIILKPFSGSGSIALFEQIVAEHGPDSYITRVASVIAGSSETVFYISAIYFSKTKIRNLSYAIPVALFCVFLAAVLGALVVRLLM
ncbi:MAG: spore maturation protein [Firmicutes bacterium]|nr:spore maturation protein [Bacillota bacterium]